MKKLNLFQDKSSLDEYFQISSEGLINLRNSYDPLDKDRNICWTTDINQELPIRMKQHGFGALKPKTVIEQFNATMEKFWKRPAMHYKEPGASNYTTQTYQQYYDKCKTFSRALIKCKISERAAINITGFNHPVWMWTFYGTIFANCIPVGIYGTNGKDICQWIANDCNAEIVILENQKYLDKYLEIWDNCPKVKYILIYNDANINLNAVPSNKLAQVMQLEDFLKFGESIEFDNDLSERMSKQKPGHCCNIVKLISNKQQKLGLHVRNNRQAKGHNDLA